jgi:hypothetical protein
MKIRILRNITVDVEKPRINEVWPVSYSRWTEIKVEEIYSGEKTSTLLTYDGDYILLVPNDAFERVKEERATPITL